MRLDVNCNALQLNKKQNTHFMLTHWNVCESVWANVNGPCDNKI